MARIERKVHYIGTWREDHVTDSTMRQIIARSQAEKGQKVKVKLSREGLNISRTVLFQENFLSSFPLPEVYFLTVNPQHPTCLLCIVADPLKKYLIVALRTASHAQSLEMMDTFQALKGQPTLQGGNVVLRRKDNGNWTLRERSQHNANRHMQQIFQEASATPSPPSSPSAHPTTPRQPNGHVSSGQLSPAPYFDGGGESGTQTSVGGRRRAHSASQTVGAEGSEEEMAMMRMEVENLTQELRDIKLVLERTGTISPRTPAPPPPPFHTLPNSHAVRTHHVTADVTKDGHSASNGPVVTAYSEGQGYTANRPGEARVFVDDHREDFFRTLARDKPASNKPLFGNARVQRQITVPEPNTPPGPVNGYGGGDAAYTIQRRVTREPVLVSAEPGRKVSSTQSLWNSGGVKVVPAPSRPTMGRHQFRSMRISRTSGVPTTVVKPIEETYARGNTLRRSPVVLVQSQVPYSLQEPARDVYIAQQHAQPSSAVYVAQRQQQHHTARPLTPNSSFRRSASPGSGARLRHDTALHHNGELDDVLL